MSVWVFQTHDDGEKYPLMCLLWLCRTSRSHKGWVIITLSVGTDKGNKNGTAQRLPELLPVGWGWDHGVVARPGHGTCGIEDTFPFTQLLWSYLLSLNIFPRHDVSAIPIKTRMPTIVTILDSTWTVVKVMIRVTTVLSHTPKITTKRTIVDITIVTTTVTTTVMDITMVIATQWPF